MFILWTKKEFDKELDLKSVKPQQKLSPHTYGRRKTPDLA